MYAVAAPDRGSQEGTPKGRSCKRVSGEGTLSGVQHYHPLDSKLCNGTHMASEYADPRAHRHLG
jgi:hypothetical protein